MTCGESGSLTVHQDSGHTVVRMEIPSLRLGTSGAMTSLRAFVVDDEQLAVDRLVRLLDATGRVVISGSGTDPVDALTQL